MWRIKANTPEAESSQVLERGLRKVKANTPAWLER